MRERYSFRFTHHEIEEMWHIFEGNSYSRPPNAEMRGLAFSFSKARQQQGMACVRMESVQRWFKRTRRAYMKANNGGVTRNATKSTRTALIDQPLNQKFSSDEETTERGSSREEGTEKEMLESPKSDENLTDDDPQNIDVSNSVERMDVTWQQRVLSLQGPVSEVDSVLARLVRYGEAQSGAGSELILRKPTESSNLFTVGQAREILEKLKETSLVDYRKYQEDFKFAIQIILEKGSLSENAKAELSLLPEKLHKISVENERIRKELADREAFIEKLQECEENSNKMIEKANVLEKKYNSFPKKMSTFSRKIAELEAALHHAKAEAEKLKCDKEDVAAELARLAEHLQSANTHYKILKAEELAVIENRIKFTECLQKNTEAWVKITNTKVI